MKDYQNDLTSFVEDFYCPNIMDSRIEGPSTYEILDYNINYVVDWPEYNIEEEINKEFGKEFARLVDEDIMKTLFGIPFIECETVNWNRPPCYPLNIQPKYSHYDKVMN